jgi:hypothetical protein
MHDALLTANGIEATLRAAGLERIGYRQLRDLVSRAAS